MVSQQKNMRFDWHYFSATLQQAMFSFKSRNPQEIKTQDM